MASRATVKVDDAALLALIRRTSGPSAIKRVEKTLREAAEELAEFARNDFPVSRWEVREDQGEEARPRYHPGRGPRDPQPDRLQRRER